MNRNHKGLQNPVVFISHASEDKDRFVLEFATKLREKGIDAWVDKWEIYPGDSLVTKIFNEGLKNAHAVVIVLSKNSIEKPWVKEELDVSVVKKIEGEIKLIPVIIEDCDVPESLRSTVWEKIKNLDDYEEELNRIVNSIYEQRDKPPIGKPPHYIKLTIEDIPGLNKIDNHILMLSCEMILKNNFGAISRNTNYMPIETNHVIKEAASIGINKQDALESLEILDRKGYVKTTKIIGGEIIHYCVSTFGFEEYAKKYIREYKSLFPSVGFGLVNKGKNAESIAEDLKLPKVIINHIFNVLSD